MLSPSLLPTTVTVSRKAWSNQRGQRVAATTTATLPASVQPMTAARIERHGLLASETGYTCYFDRDPIVAVGDTIATAGLVLAVLGPARDEAGRGRVWAVDSKSQT